MENNGVLTQTNNLGKTPMDYNVKSNLDVVYTLIRLKVGISGPCLIPVSML